MKFAFNKTFFLLVGSFLLFLSLFWQIFTPNTTLAQQGGWTEGINTVSGSNTGLPERSATEVVVSILQWLLGLIFLLTVLAFVGSGVIFIMSFSNNNLTTMAKDWLTYAIIGLVVSVLGFAIVLTISKVLLGENVGGYGGSSGGGNSGFWGNLLGQHGSVSGHDNNGNWGEITGDGHARGRIGGVDFDVPLPDLNSGNATDTRQPTSPWVNPDTGEVFPGQ